MNAAGSTIEEFATGGKVPDWKNASLALEKDEEFIGEYFPDEVPLDPIALKSQEIEYQEQRQEKWDRFFLQMAELIASKSKDPSTKCGAVIVDDKHRIIATGYNGFPRGCRDDEEIYADRELKLARVVHAETNACLQAGREAEGCTIYTWPAGWGPSCDRCSTNIIQVGIKRVVHIKDESEFASRWKEPAERGLAMYEEANVEVVSYDPED